MKVWASSTLILLPLILFALFGCQHSKAPGIEDRELQGLIDLLERNLLLLLGPEAMECRDTFEADAFPRWSFSDAELKQVRKYTRQMEPILLEKLRKGHHGAAYVLAYLRTNEALPILRERLLQERYFYGYEGWDYSKEESYLSDVQYPRHIAYITAIERISSRTIWEAVKLSDAERTLLQDEAQKAKPHQPGCERYFAAKWLLIKLTLPPELED
jgi:hypothetical protein